MTPWKYLLNQSSVEVLLTARQQQRTRLLTFFHSLAEHPTQEGDFEGRDETGRTLQLTVVGSYIVTFWPDHAVQEVRVVQIEKI